MSSVSPSDQLLLTALADQEVDAVTAMSLEARIQADPALAAEYARIIALKDRIKALGKPDVSPDFAARIAAIAAPAQSSAQPQRRQILSFSEPGWRALAASVMLTAFLASGGTYFLTSQRGDTSIEDQVASDHHRSLLAASPFDVASTDRHTVKPWLDQKLGMSPPTPNLADQGFPLYGGRVEIIGGNPVPTLVYKRRQHLISVVAIPIMGGAAQTVEPTSKIVDGYNMINWTGGGFKYLAVSDLDPDELETFVSDFRKQ